MVSYSRRSLSSFLLLTILVSESHEHSRCEGRINHRAVGNQGAYAVETRQRTYPSKPPLTSIKSEDGAMIDCVDIYSQPAFGHPSLINHTIQMKPGSFPTAMKEEKRAGSVNVDEHSPPRQSSVSCPDGTIPILRHTGHSNVGKVPPPTMIRPQASKSFGHKYAVAGVRSDMLLYGTKVTIEIWQPYVETLTEFSVAQIWVANGPTEDVNTVEAGWMVSSRLFNDTAPHLVVYWTADGYNKTGCINLRCPGFLQMSQRVQIGQALPSSIYGGPVYNASFYIFKDVEGGHWWLQLDDELVGYWPSTLFPRLSQGASRVTWGGEIFDGRRWRGPHTKTQMGSGHFPGEGLSRSSYFSNIKIVDHNRLLRTPQVQVLGTFASERHCYGIQKLGDVGGNLNLAFAYGGPGLGPGCP